MKNISKSFFDIPVLKNVDFELQEAEVHALVGLNGAGKTTLMNILAGILAPDSGEIIFDLQPIRFRNPREALEKGIYTFHQALSYLPDLSVAENIFIDNLPRGRAGMIHYKKLYAQAEALFQNMGYPMDIKAKMSTLSISQVYMVALAQAYACNARIFIMDEPMINLAQQEKDCLVKFIQVMRQEGRSIIYITHNIKEVLDLCDRVTVLRDGKRIAVCETKAMTYERMCYLISGNHTLRLYPPVLAHGEKVLLEVSGLSVEEPRLSNISFSLHEGEILGITGLTGSGRSALIKTIYGEMEKKAGNVYLAGQRVVFKNSSDALEHRFGFVSENRMREGLFLDMGISANLTITALKNIKKGIFIDLKQETKDVIDQSIDLNLEFNSLNQEIRFLSGGNQQKVLVGRSLISNADILLLDQPTKGIDIVSRSEIYVIISELAMSGKGIILVSSDMDEISGMCSRALVMKDGVLVAEVQKEDLPHIQNYC
ncbi:sugar ABC transporter ATP-binding protein [Christensenellaceae bacterium OttesenSCG-928-K19]|nr:sugar ABC transporter ATP-binding protein [Christensenellaceae bacterium OttesenSCG-928-K19]